MAVSLESAWRKWAWASLEAKRLEAEIDRALDPALNRPPLTIDHSDYEPNLHGFRVFVSTIREPPGCLGCLLADVINDYRCALDQLAWFIYQRGALVGKIKLREERNIYFPICDLRDTFKDNVSRYLPGARVTDRAIVRGYQPYKAGKRVRPRMVLSLVRDFGNADKHRVARPIGLRNSFANLSVFETHDCVVRRIRYMQTDLLQVGTELARVYVKRTGPDPDIGVQGALASDIAFDGVLWAKNLCSTSTTHIAEILNRFEPGPTDLLEHLTQWND
jgi:hypothetical protein